MSTSNETSNNIDVYQIVTNRIISLLENGTIPWEKPWKEAEPPKNLLSKRYYRGINTWLLSSLDYENHLYLTWDQIKKLGASVLKNQKGHIVVFWKTINKDAELQESDEGNNKRKYAILRYYKVFNVAQIKNLPQKLFPEPVESDLSPLAECEAIISTMPQCPTIKFGEKMAFYSIEGDYINMPKKKTFKNIESYYATLFHELVHSSGHSSRLSRKTITQIAEFGSDPYSIEELIAELGSCYLCNGAGILPKQIDNSAAYIQGWLKQLKSDKKFIVFAAAHAQRATDFILNIKETDVKDEVEQSEVIIN